MKNKPPLYLSAVLRTMYSKDMHNMRLTLQIKNKGVIFTLAGVGAVGKRLDQAVGAVGKRLVVEV